MKYDYFKCNIVTIGLVIMCSVFSELYSQTNDIVVMSNGDIKQGKVTAMEDQAVKFVHSGEELEYTLKTSEISKIQFASGREQTFTATTAAAAPSAAAASVGTTSTAAERKGKMAVLPFEFYSNDPGMNPENMGTQIQHDCINSFKHNSHGVVLQDPRITNSILLKNNIDHNQLAAITPDEMAVLLGVEYVAYGIVNVENKGTLTSGSAVTTYKDKENRDYTEDSRNTKSKSTAVSAGSSSTTINYDTKVELSIYNDQGSSVYSDARDAFGLSMDSYNNGLNYMVKRTPFGSKKK